MPCHVTAKCLKNDEVHLFLVEKVHQQGVHIICVCVCVYVFYINSLRHSTMILFINEASTWDSADPLENNSSIFWAVQKYPPTPPPPSESSRPTNTVNRDKRCTAYLNQRRGRGDRGGSRFETAGRGRGGGRFDVGGRDGRRGGRGEGLGIGGARGQAGVEASPRGGIDGEEPDLEEGLGVADGLVDIGIGLPEKR